MTLRAIIIDDEQKGINTIKLLIDRHVAGIKIVAESTKPKAGIELIENYKPEIVFLDINMPEMNAFELFDKLEWKDFDLVFITAHQEYALRALKINAVDYLLKPIDQQELIAAATKIINRRNSTEKIPPHPYIEMIHEISAEQHQKLLVHTKNSVQCTNLSDIICLESKTNYTLLSLESEAPILATKNLKEFDLELCASGYNFMRVHRSFIVNLHKVTRYLKSSESIEMADHQKIPLAKSKRGLFFEWLGQ
jgi:two-component system LytT family response regulator